MRLASLRVAGVLAACLLVGGCTTVHSSGLAFTSEEEGQRGDARFDAAVLKAHATVREVARGARLTEFNCSRPGMSCTGYVRGDVIVHAFVTSGPPRRMTVLISQTTPLMDAPVLRLHEELIARVRGSVAQVRVETY